MTRVHHARPQHAAAPPQHRSVTLNHPRAAVKKKKPYKIVLEAVTQEKKKLHSILTYASNAPKGFGFVPAGHPDITEWCKEQCRQRNLDVHIVSAKPKNKTHADPEKLSHHVHRVGHHFPIEIINLACVKFGYIYDETNGLQKDKSADRTNWIARRVEDYSSRQSLHGRPATEKDSKEQTRGAVREMFPKIPEADLTSIVNHAFEEGTNRVGNAKELSLARRVQLAVVAHIRHVYTDYDKILKQGSWTEARQKVEHVSLAKLKEWRDEAGEQSNEVEDTFREIIVLDDEESSDDDSMSSRDEREQSMEIVFSPATQRDLQPERYVERARMDGHTTRRLSRRTILVQPYPPPRASHLQVLSNRQPLTYTSPRHTPPYVPLPGSHQPPRRESHHMAHSRPIDSPIRSPARQPVPRATQPLMQVIDGQMYHLEPVEEPHGPSRPPQHHSGHAATRYSQNGLVPPPPQNSLINRPQVQAGRTSDQDVVLPSVEAEIIDLSSPRRTVNGSSAHIEYRHSTNGYTELQSPKRKLQPPFVNDRDIHAEIEAKRMRPVQHEGRMPRAGSARHVVPAHSGDYPRMSLHSRPRPQHSDEIVDLTSSPRRPPPSGTRAYHSPHQAYPAAEPSGFPYVPVTRRSPLREPRGTFHGAHAVEQPHPYVSSSDIYERRAPPAREYMPVRGEPPHHYGVEHGPRYLRSGVNYGGYDLH